MRALVLHFDAPMMSWGTEGRLTNRDAGTRPTLSGIIGLIANALGRGRDDDMADLAFDLVTRVDRAGHEERDYVTIGGATGIGQAPKAPGKRPGVSDTGKVSVRYLLADAAMVAVIGQTEQTIDLDTVRDALLRPARTLYLGRRCYPIGAPVVRGPVVETDSLQSLLETIPLAPRHDDTVSVTTTSTDPMAEMRMERPVLGRRAFMPRLTETVAHPAARFPLPEEQSCT
ncbi:type I-E CRISPR-associated protein Cas5/CasD [Brachybacterium hainanense]|uniref:Type I-E CRISPR-associated protein Cas5/CasD n=1 Tax=Brachybacterium hainanense TaxID=1541174 RepID=A0ABV6RBZ8_9MICO